MTYIRHVVKLLNLVPTNLISDRGDSESLVTSCNADGIQSTLSALQELAKLYTSDLPVPALLETEYSSWLRHWRLHKDNLPDSIQAVLKLCDRDTFRNIYVLLHSANHPGNNVRKQEEPQSTETR